MDNLTEQVLVKVKVSRRKHGGLRKYGRNKEKCQYYRSARYRKNKLAKLQKHMEVHNNDNCASSAYERLKNTL